MTDPYRRTADDEPSEMGVAFQRAERTRAEQDDERRLRRHVEELSALRDADSRGWNSTSLAAEQRAAAPKPTAKAWWAVYLVDPSMDSSRPWPHGDVRVDVSLIEQALHALTHTGMSDRDHATIRGRLLQVLQAEGIAP